ncbi:MAG: type VI secretion system tip protein TssI/VgrG [Minicystis sp.]
MGDARFSFSIDGLSQPLHVAGLEGREDLSDLFRFDLTLASADDALALADVVGRTGVLRIEGQKQPRFVHGIVARFEQGDEGKNVTTYEATLVPAAFLLKYRVDCRIFQQRTVPEIITEVLGGAGLPSSGYRLVIHGDHPAWEYCVQYRESDWAFVCRLMEQEGIFFFFEHTAEGHVLVMSDTLHVHEPIPGGEVLPFRPALGALVQGEHVSRFRHAQEVRPGKVTLRDFNFKNPGLSLESGAAAERDGGLEVYDYPGSYDVPKIGAGLAKIRLEEWQSARRVGRGESSCVRLAPGHLFALEEHHREAFNARYLITRVDHRGTEPVMSEAGTGDAATYQATFHCIPAEVQFRPAQRTAKPTIKGVQTAIVVGPPGEEIYTDQHGRVKVQFHWDRQGRRDEHSSSWIRVSQLMAGQGWGAMYIPRVGHEVIVDFLEGDPDRPIITGRVYHGTNQPPLGLPAEKTRSSIKTNTTPGGGGSNELRFEDQKGKEEIYLHGQRDWNIAVEHDKDQTIGHDETLHVAKNRSKSVGVDESESIGENKNIRVGMNHSEMIGQNETIMVGQNRTLTVGQNEAVMVGQNEVLMVAGQRTKTVAGSESESVGVNKTIEVGAHHKETIGAGMSLAVGGSKKETVARTSAETVAIAKTLTVGGAYAITVGATMTTNVAGISTEHVGLSKTVSAGTKLTIECGASKLTMDKAGNVVIEASNMKITATGDVKVAADGSVDVETSGAVKVRAGTVDMN